MNDKLAEEAVELHTRSGRRHKFGPLIEPRTPWDEPYWVAQCNRSIITTPDAQSAAIETDRCKRCFPEPSR